MINLAKVWSAVGVFNAAKIPVGFSTNHCCSYHLMQWWFDPASIIVAARYFKLWLDLTDLDLFQDICVDVYGADYYYYFVKGFRLEVNDLSLIKKHESFLVPYKFGVQCRQRFCYGN